MSRSCYYKEGCPAWSQTPGFIWTPHDLQQQRLNDGHHYHPKLKCNCDTVSYPTVKAGCWLNENPNKPEGCAGAAGAGWFAPKVNTPGLLGKLKLEVLLPNWNTEPGKKGWKRKRETKLKWEFVLSSKIFTFFLLFWINFYRSLLMTKLGQGVPHKYPPSP